MDSESTVFSSDDFDAELVENQPLRVSGLVSAGFGLLSIVSLAGPYLWCVPAMAVILGLVALRPARGLYVGKKAALFGLGLGLIFGAWAIARYNTLHSMRVTTAKDFAINWLETFGYEQPEFSFEMTQGYSTRKYKTSDLKSYYQIHAAKVLQEEGGPGEATSEPTPTIETFLENDVVKRLIASGTKPKWELVEIGPPYRSYTIQKYDLVFRDTTDTIGVPLEVTMRSYQQDDGLPIYWHVDKYEFKSN